MICREETPTIMDGLVVRYYIRLSDGTALYANEPQVSASRNGVSLDGAWPVLNELVTLKQMLEYAWDDYEQLSRGTPLRARPSVSNVPREVFRSRPAVVTQETSS